MPELGNGELEAWRNSAQVYRRGFMRALTFFPSPIDEHPHMRAALDAMMQDVPQYGDLRMAIEDVTLFERWHPDMDTFAAGLGLTPEIVDAIYRVAIAAETGANDETLAGMVDAPPS